MYKKEVSPFRDREIRRPDYPTLVFATDFGDDLAIGECQLSLMAVFQQEDVACPYIVTVNDILPFNKVNAAFQIDRLSKQAPPRTVFAGVVDPGVGTDRKGVIIQTKRDHVFVGPDNGILYPACSDEGISKAWQIDYSRRAKSSTTFHGRDIFSPIAAEIACGFPLGSFGPEINGLFEYQYEPNQVLHIDPYGNYKINNKDFAEAGNVGVSSIYVGAREIPFAKTFEDVEVEHLLAYVGSSDGLLEIAKRQGSAAKELGYEVGNCLGIRPNTQLKDESGVYVFSLMFSGTHFGDYLGDNGRLLTGN